MDRIVIKLSIAITLFFIPTQIFAANVFHAIDNYDEKSVKEYIKNGGDVNAKDKDGQTLLMRAVLPYTQNKNDLIKFLIEAKADVNVCSADGTTALMLACTIGNAEAVKLLINAKANINFANYWGKTALMMAAGTRHNEPAKMDQAYLKGKTAAVKLLIAAGADIHAIDKRGMTALAAATESGHNEIMELLKQAETKR